MRLMRCKHVHLSQRPGLPLGLILTGMFVFLSLPALLAFAGA